MSELDQFSKTLEHFCAARGLQSGRWKGGAKSTPNLIEVATSPKIVLYVKESNIGEGFWGLNENQMKALQNSSNEWAVILLLSTGHTAYLLSGTQVVAAAQGKKWTHSKQDYKIHEGDELSDAVKFSNHPALFDYLFETPTKELNLVAGNKKQT